MSTATTNNTKITFTREQKNFLDEFLSSKVSEYVGAIMEDDDEETDTHQGKILRGFLVGPRKYMDGVVDGQKTRCLLGFYFWGSPDRNVMVCRCHFVTIMKSHELYLASCSLAA